jgi:hypothetical protein
MNEKKRKQKKEQKMETEKREEMKIGSTDFQFYF